MKVTVELLNEMRAGRDVRITFKKQFGTEAELKDVVAWCLESGEKNTNYALWLVFRMMQKEQRVRYAIFSAREVIGFFEKKYPNDSSPRKAIEAAEAWVNDPSDKKKRAAAYAAYAAYAAAYAAAADAAREKARMEMNKKCLEFGLQLLYGKE